MIYMGSKNRISKDIVPIIQSYIDKDCNGYLEPFVGGANIIDKIKCDNKIGSDINKYLIDLLKYVQTNFEDIPKTISEDEYKKVKNNKEKYPNWYVGLVGFCASFSSKFFAGYARGFKADRITKRDRANEAIRNLIKQAPNLKNIKFICSSFLDLNDDIFNYVIYCDIPYRNSTKYKTEEFPYELFYNWCRQMSKNNVVLISEYHMPNDFKCIWEKETKVNFDSHRTSKDKNNIRTEKLFIYE